MARLLIALFTYNRPRLLLNAARSIERFAPPGERLVVDDGSSVPGAAQALQHLGAGGWSVEIVPRPAAGSHGGYYANLGTILRRAIDQGFDYLWTFEDDHQLVWHKVDQLAYAEAVFRACPDAAQLQLLMHRRILPIHAMAEFIGAARAYRTNRGFSPSTIWNLSVFRAAPDYQVMRPAHGNGETANSVYWLRRGFRVYYQVDPTVAMLPWVPTAVRADAEPIGDLLADPAAPLLLAPLSPRAIDFLRHRSPTLPAYQEYFDLAPDNSDRPIWHQRGQLMHRYYQLCREIVAAEDAAGASPIPIPVRARWEDAQLPPNRAHMSWTPDPPTVAALSLLHRLARAMLPAGVVERLGDWRTFNWRDYLGYRELCRRLVREVRAAHVASP